MIRRNFASLATCRRALRQMQHALAIALFSGGDAPYL
jgi:hypothetical protein